MLVRFFLINDLVIYSCNFDIEIFSGNVSLRIDIDSTQYTLTLRRRYTSFIVIILLNLVVINLWFCIYNIYSCYYTYSSTHVCGIDYCMVSSHNFKNICEHKTNLKWKCIMDNKKNKFFWFRKFQFFSYTLDVLSCSAGTHYYTTNPINISCILFGCQTSCKNLLSTSL